MYLEHYGLKEPPFSITPDPRFVFLSERHRDALAHLLFGIGQGGSGGFVQLTGEVGTGKTTLSRLLLEQLPENTRVALVLNPRLSPVELLQTICEELHLPAHHNGEGPRGSLKALTDALNAYLLDAYAQGLRVVLIIDEAQNLSVDALEQVRLLTNLETDTQKLLQIILLGQPELRDMLARPELRQLAQRITARFHLTPLDAAETTHYLRHRYRVAGGVHLPFDDTAIKRIHTHSGGVPRLINVVAERALLGGYARDETRINARTVDQAAREALAPAAKPSRKLQRAAAAGAAAFALIALAYAWRASPEKPPALTAAAAPTTPTRQAPNPAHSTQSLASDAFIARLAAIDGASVSAARSAWQELLTRWQLPADDAAISIASNCVFAALSQDTYCLHARGTLDRVVAQDRPVLLHLRVGDSESAAVLLGADARHVRLWLDGQTMDVGRIALARVWNGEYTQLWRGPSNLTLPLTQSKAAMEWARSRLTPRYLPADAAAITDSAMHDAVLRFQHDHGLAADGIVGPETLAAMATGTDAGPRLRENLE